MSQQIKCALIVPWTSSIWKEFRNVKKSWWRVQRTVKPCGLYISMSRRETTSIAGKGDKFSTVQRTETKKTKQVLIIQRTEMKGTEINNKINMGNYFHQIIFIFWRLFFVFFKNILKRLLPFWFSETRISRIF